MFRDTAPITAGQAQRRSSLVSRHEWRILVGDDAVALDELVRERPGEAYDQSFVELVETRHIFDVAT